MSYDVSVAACKLISIKVLLWCLQSLPQMMKATCHRTGRKVSCTLCLLPTLPQPQALLCSALPWPALHDAALPCCISLYPHQPCCYADLPVLKYAHTLLDYTLPSIATDPVGLPLHAAARPYSFMLNREIAHRTPPPPPPPPPPKQLCCQVIAVNKMSAAVTMHSPVPCKPALSCLHCHCQVLRCPVNIS